MKHIYHYSCILKWLKSSIKCPICKYDEIDILIEKNNSFNYYYDDNNNNENEENIFSDDIGNNSSYFD